MVEQRGKRLGAQANLCVIVEEFLEKGGSRAIAARDEDLARSVVVDAHLPPPRFWCGSKLVMNSVAPLPVLKMRSRMETAGSNGGKSWGYSG